MTSRLSSKGQLTIPKKVREHLKLKQGDKIGFKIDHKGRVIMQIKNRSIFELWDIIPKTDRTYSIDDINEAIEQGWTDRWHRSQ
ncbi:MAG: type II toxin-antitoxin system PrlF family antitoxin [Saprospiraceae bacterium]|nr:type II toxin-antitoxin system PrlF family antitoxin [Saprospiraceae bacterium]